jgi:hypothetical protein
MLSPSPALSKAANDLKGTVETDPDHARALIAKLIGKITLRVKDGHLWAEMRGNVAGLLAVDDQVGNTGAGSPVIALYSWPLVTAEVAG